MLQNTLTQDRPVIHDDSHARAIMKGALHQAEIASSHFDIARMHASGPKSRVKRYRHLNKKILSGLGPAWVGQEKIVGLQSSKQQQNIHFFFGRMVMPDEYRVVLNGDRLVPISFISIRSKYLERTSATKMADITEHAMIRIIKRNQCHNLHQIGNVILKMIKGIFIINSRAELIPGRYIALSEDGYMPLEVTQEPGRLLVLSWIARKDWSKKKSARVERYLNMESPLNITIIDAKRFNGESDQGLIVDLKD